MVAIVEDAEPHYLIGLSTGTLASIQYLVEDPTQLCPTTLQYGSKECISERRTIQDIGTGDGSTTASAQDSKAQDEAIRQAFLQLQSKQFPQELLFVKVSEEVGADSYVAQATLFEPNAGESNLKWRVITVSSASENTSDAVVVGDPFFGIILFLGSVGVVVCAGLFTYLWRNRGVRVVAFGDWRFTCAFVAGCGLWNTASFYRTGRKYQRGLLDTNVVLSLILCRGVGTSLHQVLAHVPVDTSNVQSYDYYQHASGRVYHSHYFGTGDVAAHCDVRRSTTSDRSV